MARRSKARQVVLQMLYQTDVNPDVGVDTIRGGIRERLKNGDLERFAWQIYSGVMEHRAQIDARIEELAENWTLERMAPTDRNAIRIGAFELLFFDTPDRVAIDEAIELAKKFGNKNSSQFVNGILDRLLPSA